MNAIFASLQRKPVQTEVVYKPTLKTQFDAATANCKTTSERIRNLLPETFKLEKSKLHGLRIHLRNLANEVEKMEAELVQLRKQAGEAAAHAR